MIALLPNQTWDYVPKSDRALPAEQRTVFHLRALTKREKHAFHNLRSRPSVFVGTEGDCRYESVRAGLVGWTRFNGPDGRPATFETAKEDVEVLGRKCRPITDACLDYLSDALEVELSLEIVQGSELNPDDRKNSLSPQA